MPGRGVTGRPRTCFHYVSVGVHCADVGIIVEETGEGGGDVIKRGTEVGEAGEKGDCSRCKRSRSRHRH
jgi:hypothetical protein